MKLRPAGDPELRSGFLAGMARMTSAVTVVTTDGSAGRFGQTVSAVTSVCADPPVLLACLYRDTPVAQAVRVNGCFAVNLLSPEHLGLAESFAGRTPVPARYRFDDDWRALRTGSPIRHDVPAAFDCQVADVTAVGTHLVVYGQVVAVLSGEQPDLAYRNRGYVLADRSLV